MKTTAFLLTMLVPAVVSAQQKPTTGYAPVNGLKMYYEVHGSGEPLKASSVSFGNASSASLTMPSRRNTDEMTTTFRTLSGLSLIHI